MSVLIRMAQFSVLVVGIIWILFLIYELIQGRNRAPYIPSSKKAIRFILDTIALPKTGFVIDLGAGDGKFLRAAKQKYPELQLRGYEISPLALLVARLKNTLSRTKIQVINQDMFTTDVSKADVIFCFLLPKDLKQLETKLKTQLKPGSKVISNTFSFPTWQPELEISPKTSKLHGFIRVYVVK